MQIQTTDFNNAGQIIGAHYQAEWQEIECVLTRMPLYLKPSDQFGIQGRPIFDPVATNAHIKSGLNPLQ
jgi:hypothetical protein